MIGFLAPTDWAADNATEADLGSTAPILLPGGQFIAIGKEAERFLMNTRHLGGIGGEEQSVAVCNVRGADAYYHGYPLFPCPSAGRVGVHTNDPSIHKIWQTFIPMGSPSKSGGVAWCLNAGERYRLNSVTVQI